MALKFQGGKTYANTAPLKLARKELETIGPALRRISSSIGAFASGMPRTGQGDVPARNDAAAAASSVDDAAHSIADAMARLKRLLDAL